MSILNLSFVRECSLAALKIAVPVLFFHVEYLQAIVIAITLSRVTETTAQLRLRLEVWWWRLSSKYLLSSCCC